MTINIVVTAADNMRATLESNKCSTTPTVDVAGEQGSRSIAYNQLIH